MTEPRVVHESDVVPVRLPHGRGWIRNLIDRESGSRNLTQRVIAVYRGNALAPEAPRGSEEAVYVADGLGELSTNDGIRTPLFPGIAALIPPTVQYTIENHGNGRLRLVSVVARTSTRPRPATEIGPTTRTAAEQDESPLPAGDDRSFKLLIDPRYGARNVTQFVGFIHRSKAPPHTHTYEEAIYILEGEGVVHIGNDREEPIRAGTSIFLPPGTAHCLENRRDTVLKLLGVFSPPGSPADRMEGQRTTTT